MIKYAIFDLDGTLLNTLGDLHTAVNVALAMHNHPTRTLEEVRQFVGDGVRVLMERAAPAGADTPHFEELLADFRTYYAAHNREKTAPYPGILDLLHLLRSAGVGVAVVSNKFDAATRAMCAEYFGDLVQCAVGESPSVARKPAPDSVFSVMKTVGATPSDSVYIGDSEVDIATARAAGIPCISVLWGFRDIATLQAAGGTTYVRDVKELEKILLFS